jgi:hypothetical protein
MAGTESNADTWAAEGDANIRPIRLSLTGCVTCAGPGPQRSGSSLGHVDAPVASGAAAADRRRHMSSGVQETPG